jgi:hypothetical protein
VPNYGDIALNLPPSWRRTDQHDKNYALGTVGHEDGVADARLKDDPEKRHQFAFVDPRYRDEVDINRSKGYVFVKKGEWEKNDNLWEWDAEGFCVFRSQRLMARPAELFFADMAQRRQQRDRVMGTNRDEEAAQEIARRAGIEITGSDEGRPIARRRRA